MKIVVLMEMVAADLDSAVTRGTRWRSIAWMPASMVFWCEIAARRGT
jgi:hypothetical protein